MGTSRLVLLLIPTCLLGCPLDRHETEWERTPAGWKVEWRPEGSEAAGLYTKDEVFLLFDLRMEEALASVGRPRGIEDYGFILIDNASITLDNGLHAAGMWDPNGKITVCLYPNQSLPVGTPAPPEALPWTVYVGPLSGLTWYATYPASVPFAALDHELLHAHGETH